MRMNLEPHTHQFEIVEPTYNELRKRVVYGNASAYIPIGLPRTYEKRVQRGARKAYRKHERGTARARRRRDAHEAALAQAQAALKKINP